MKSTEVKEIVEKLDHLTALDLLEVFYRNQNNGELPQPNEEVLLPVGGAVLEAYGLEKDASTQTMKEKIMEIIVKSGYDERLLEMVEYIPLKLNNDNPELEDKLAVLFPYNTEIQKSLEASMDAMQFTLN